MNDKYHLMAPKNKKVDRYLNNNTDLPIEVHIDWASHPEWIEEFRKCKDDIIYFAQNYFTIVHLDRGKELMQLYEPQKRAVEKIFNNRRTIICASRQIGKRLALDTPVPTPNGWTTMGQLKAGDTIFDWNGNPTIVLYAHDILDDRNCYELIFSNGEKIIADEEHEWFTQHRNERKRGIDGSVKTTKQIFDTLTVGRKIIEPAHRIELKHTVQYPEKEYIIDPYLLGYWLGDGTASNSGISVGEEDIDEMLKHFEYIPHKSIHRAKLPRTLYTVNILKDLSGRSFVNKLQELGLRRNKHIPRQYIESSVEQRLELLRGLMDTDGYCNTRGIMQFYSTIESVASNVAEILNSLGIQSSITSKIPKIKDKEYSRCYIVTFKTNIPMFKLTRKLDRQMANVSLDNSRNSFVYIKDIKKVASVSTRCITVDNIDQMYLVGKSFIPTHNTSIMTVICLWYALFNRNFNIAVLANKEKMAKEILNRIKVAYKGLPNWLKAGVPEFTKENILFSNESKIFVSTTSADSIRGEAVNLLFLDEFAFVPNEIADEFYASAIPTLSSSTKSKIVIVSTPNGASGQYYDIFTKAEKGENGWAFEKMYWHEIPGRDAVWKDEQLKLINHDMDKWNQEYELQFLTNGQSVFNVDLLNRMKLKCVPPLKSFDDGEYIIYHDPVPGRIISIGVDVAEGVGQDYSVAQIMDITDPLDIRHCGVFASNIMQPYVFTEKLNQIARSWGRPFLCIERNGPGGQVIDALINIHNYDNIVSMNKVNDSANRYDGQVGIVTHQNSKFTGITNMRYFLETLESVGLRDIKTVVEFETFVRKNRSWTATKGYHDDRIMSLVWALIPLEKEVAREYLYVIEFDEAGQVIRIEDPNQAIADKWLLDGSKKIAYAKFGGQPPPTIFQFGHGQSFRDGEISGYMSTGYRMV